MNSLKTFLLIAFMTALFLAVGFFLGGETGAIIAFGFALLMNGFAYWNSDKLVLRMHKAVKIEYRDNPGLFSMVQDLSGRAGLPMPKVYIIETSQPNAFATGRNPQNAAVAVTRGLLDSLGRDELEGVIAHELAHIKNRDTLTMTITATLAGAISMLAHYAIFFGRGRNNPLGVLGVILIFILAPLAAMLVQMAISRTREYSADKTAAEISGNPLALASALRQIENGVHTFPNQNAEKNPASAHLFIMNPLSGARADKLFSTHPSTANRVMALEKMVGVLIPNAFEAASVNPIQRGRGGLNPFKKGGPRNL